ncbi:potassium transporter TrkG [Fluviibacterium sp. DFM31]|uniref:Potassium transporter TrkG n=1 Tax=Meridianimarinicoccus marinus TaxID=3231483 RepID=A0ABV3L8K8_9RHOB
MTTSRIRRQTQHQRWYDRLPLLVMTAAVAAALMLVPAIYAGWVGDHDAGRPFLYGALTFAAIILFIGLSVWTMDQNNAARAMLLSLVGTFALLPVMLALPVVEAMPGLSFRSAYLEMVSSLTTTGATVFSVPSRVPDTVHLWRALMGWYGGFIMWVASIAILAPLRIGGFELVLTSVSLGRDATLGRAVMAEYPMQRVWRFCRALAPVYGGLTLVAWLALLVAGETPFIAACHAMSVLSTSGISPVATLGQAASGLAGEIVLFVFLFFALSRGLFARDVPTPLGRKWYQDPELRLAVVMIAVVPLLVFSLHWVSLLEVLVLSSDLQPLRGYWGGQFMTLSFLSTGGFISADWETARNWSGLTTPGLILMGLAMIGGGVATTAGGVKLLRVYALARHSQFEMAKLVHPSIVANPGTRLRRFKPEAAYVAWLYFMIFAVTIAALMLAFSVVGADFDTSLVLTVAGLTTTGPLTIVAGDVPIELGLLSGPQQLLLCVAMVLGRLETLALIALLNPEFWRA